MSHNKYSDSSEDKPDSNEYELNFKGDEWERTLTIMNIKKYFDSDSSEEDSSSESHCEIIRYTLLEAIERRDDLNTIKSHLNDRRIKEVDEQGNSCLHAALLVIPYDLDVIKELLKHGADINLNNCDNDTPLILALKNPLCDVDLIKVLLRNGANPNCINHLDETPLEIVLQKCLQESNNNTHLEVLKLLLENGADPNSRSISISYYTALELCVKKYLQQTSNNYRHLEIIELLLKSGAQPNIDDGNNVTAFLMAVHPPYCDVRASANSLNVIKLFLKYDPSIVTHKYQHGRTALHIALCEGASSNIVKELIKMGADVHATDYLSNTPLHLTTLSKYSSIETLVKHKAELNAINRSGNTPLLEAVKQKSAINTTAIIALIELGANVDIKDSNNKSALYYSMKNPFVPLDVIKLLLEKGDELVKLYHTLVVADYNFAINKVAARLFLQYFLFYKVLLSPFDIFYEPKNFILFDNYQKDFRNVLLNFRDNCVAEVRSMKCDHLTNGQELYFYVRHNIGTNAGKHEYPALLIKEVLDRIVSNKYPNCTDLLRASIKRNALLNYLPFLLVYTPVLDEKVKKSIILDNESLMNLAKFLDRDTLLCLVETFHDKVAYNK